MSKWLTSPGDDQCPYCETNYHQETGYYCWNCDSPLCTTCVVAAAEASQWLCPDCDTRKEDEEIQP